jgi:hypothetical protein
MQKQLSWEASIHLYRDKTILKQLGIAISIPFGVLFAFLFWVASRSTSPSRFYGIYMIALVFGLTFLLLAVVHQNKMHVRYVLTQKYITLMMTQRQSKKNQRVNRATMLAGLVTLNPTAMGAGLLAAGHQQQTMKLIDIKKIDIDDFHHRLVIKDSYYEFIVQCSAQNYQDVKIFLQQHSLFKKYKIILILKHFLF